MHKYRTELRITTPAEPWGGQAANTFGAAAEKDPSLSQFWVRSIGFPEASELLTSVHWLNGTAQAEKITCYHLKL